MSYTARLVNPTPIAVEWPWHRGVVLKVDAFGYKELDAQTMEQFMPDQPGADGVQQLMNHYGVFLQDSSKTYEMQAEEAVRASIKAKTELATECEKGVRGRAAQSGNSHNEDAISNELERSGYTKLFNEVKMLQKVLKDLSAANAKTRRTAHEQYDPEKTLLFTNPPKQFPSATAMKMFLSMPENKELAEKQEAYLSQTNRRNTTAQKKEAE